MIEREIQMYLNFEQPRLMERFFSHMDKEAVDSLTSAQKQAIGRAITRSFLDPSTKIIDVRRSFSLFRKRFFLLFQFGRDVRSGEPRYFSKYLARTRFLTNCIFVAFICLYSFCGALGFLWIVQKILGLQFLRIAG